MKKLNSGITIVEIIITLALSLVVVGIASTLFVTFFRNYSFSFGNTQAVSVTQNAITQMLREIREMQPAETGAWPLAETQDNSLTFYSEITGDNQVDQVRYFLDGNNLLKTVVEPSGDPPTYLLINAKTKVIAENVRPEDKEIFTYYNGNWPTDQVNNPLDPTSRISAARYIEVYVRILTDPNHPEEAFESTGGVQLRNLKDNL